MKLIFSALLFLCVVLTAQGQVDFHAYLSSEEMIEGGRVDKMSIAISNLVFSLHPPRKWFREVDDPLQKIVFTAPTGKSAITVQFTTNSPGRLPDSDTLKAQALQAHPGAGFVQTGSLQTRSQSAVFFDLARMPAPGVVQRLCHAYVSDPLGVVEFTLASTDDEFLQRKQTLIGLLRSFNFQPAKAH